MGELRANRPKLRDVARIRYPFVGQGWVGQDPLPHIRRRVREIHSSVSRHRGRTRGGVLPFWQSLTHDVLFDYRGAPSNGKGGGEPAAAQTLLLEHNVHISLMPEYLSVLGHDLDDEAALDTPDVDNIMAKFVVDSDMALKRLRSGLLLVVPDGRKDKTHSAIIERIVADYRDGSQLLGRVECKPFLGEDM